MIAMRVLVLSAVMFAWSTAASASASDNGLVLVRGDAAEARRIAVGAAIETATRAAGWALPAKPLPKKETDALLNCADSKTPWVCVSATPGASGIRQVFVVGVQNSQSNNGVPMIIITAKLIIPESQTVIVRQRFCEQCADDRLVEASTELVQQILRDVAVRSGRTIVSIRSNPVGAKITLDGTPMGATDAAYGTYPGKHTVVVELDDYATETRELVVEEGKTAELSLTLRSTVPGPKKDPGPKKSVDPPSRLLPGAAIAGGTLLLAISGYALFRDGQDDAKFTYDDATPVAIVSGVLGLAAIGTGVYLLWRGSDSSAPVMTVSARSATAGWGWRF